MSKTFKEQVLDIIEDYKQDLGHLGNLHVDGAMIQKIQALDEPLSMDEFNTYCFKHYDCNRCKAEPFCVRRQGTREHEAKLKKIVRGNT